jgi:hypothetical protein
MPLKLGKNNLPPTILHSANIQMIMQNKIFSYPLSLKFLLFIHWEKADICTKINTSRKMKKGDPTQERRREVPG